MQPNSLAAPAAYEIQETNAEMLSLSRYSHVQPIENEVVIFLFGNLKVSICSMISNSKSLPQFWLGEASDSFSNKARDGGTTLVCRCWLIFCWKVAWNYRFQWKKNEVCSEQVLGVRPEQTTSEAEVAYSSPLVANLKRCF